MERLTQRQRNLAKCQFAISSPHCATCRCKKVASVPGEIISSQPEVSTPRGHSTRRSRLRSKTREAVMHDTQCNDRSAPQSEALEYNNGNEGASFQPVSQSSSTDGCRWNLEGTPSSNHSLDRDNLSNSPIVSDWSPSRVEGSSSATDWLMSQASFRSCSLTSSQVQMWVAYAEYATIWSMSQTLRTWIQSARSPSQAGTIFHLPSLMPVASENVEQELTLAEQLVKQRTSAQALGGQAVLCQRLALVSLYRLHQRTRRHWAYGWGFRDALFRRCYPEYASGGSQRLAGLEGPARSALNRMTRDIHFGGILCRFIDRGPIVEAAILLHPAIPDNFLRRLTRPQMDLWADLVYRFSDVTSSCLVALWKATALVVNRSVDLPSLMFRLEQSEFDLEPGAAPPSTDIIEHLLAPIPIAQHDDTELALLSSQSSSFVPSPCWTRPLEFEICVPVENNCEQMELDMAMSIPLSSSGVNTVLETWQDSCCLNQSTNEIALDLWNDLTTPSCSPTTASLNLM